MSNGRLNKPTPKTQREISVEQHKSTYVPAGNPNYADPNVPGVNRALQTSFKGDNVKPFSIGIKDIDDTTCASTTNPFPVNDAVKNFDTIYFLFSIIFQFS